MSGQRIGYIRVSTLDQHTKRQLDGIEVDKTFTDKASGKDTKRPQLELMMSFVRSGDTVIVHSMDRLARNLDGSVAIPLASNLRYDFPRRITRTHEGARPWR
jgi:DNA invertase Pin-like site-specific DNA recombinase